MNHITRLRTLMALGPSNLARVGLYRIGLRSGLHPVQRISGSLPTGPFFSKPLARSNLPEPNRSWEGRLNWYDWKEVRHDGAPPDWFAHPFGSEPHQDASQPWWQIPDFGTGDIKNIWELSRMGWAVAMATQAAAGDAASLDRLNTWLGSWTEANPAYCGPNWKCGQEASVRVMHVLLATLVLGQDKEPLPDLVAFIETHLQRIAPTLSYAIGQQNNHGTSEAAAMFIGGEFLAQNGSDRGRKWADRGRRLLENRATTLIEPDGSFSQYSVNYHRLMLDGYCLAEAWRRRHGLPAFSHTCLRRLRAATDWLDAMIERSSGDAPNIGANDGARIIPLTDTGYRDFRPTLQLASALFREDRALEQEGRWDDPLRWLDIALPTTLAPSRKSLSFDDGGYHVLRTGNAFAVLRYPRFRFRPSQADALHFDLWARGRNLLRDGGTYSYNDPQGVGLFLAGTAAHNTATFDARDQMPRLGRFLFGEWLRTSATDPVRNVDGGMEAKADYRDGWGAQHRRRVRLTEKGFTCIDQIGGRFAKAVLRWRLLPGAYELQGNLLVGEHFNLIVTVEGSAHTLILDRIEESRHYQQLAETPCLEVSLEGPGRIVTDGRFRITPIEDG